MCENISIYIDFEGCQASVHIRYAHENGIPMPVWQGMASLLHLEKLCSDHTIADEKGADQALKSLKDDIKKICEKYGYQTVHDGSNYKGQWDDKEGSEIALKALDEKAWDLIHPYIAVKQ